MIEQQPISYPAEDKKTANLRLRAALGYLRNYISGYCVIMQPKKTLSGITPEENILSIIDKALAGYEALKPVGDLLPALRMFQREEISMGRVLEIIVAWRRGDGYELPLVPDESRPESSWVVIEALKHDIGRALETISGLLVENAELKAEQDEVMPVLEAVHAATESAVEVLGNRDQRGWFYEGSEAWTKARELLKQADIRRRGPDV